MSLKDKIRKYNEHELYPSDFIELVNVKEAVLEYWEIIEKNINDVPTKQEMWREMERIFGDWEK